MLLALTGKDISFVERALRQRGWATVAVAGDFLLRLSHPDAGRLDVMVSGTDYETGAIKRAHRVDHDDRLSFRTLAVEDVVILKLIADRPQDEADVVSIILAKPDLDEAYMAHWFDEFDHLDIGGRYERHLANVKQRGLLRERQPPRRS